MKEIFKKIPRLPISALIFYLSILALWKTGIIPSPNNILQFLESLYGSYGLIGLFIASLLEGIVYLGLYFPGSLIVTLAVILSDGSFLSLLSISLVVATALTVSAFVSYLLGRRIIKNKIAKTLLTKRSSKEFRWFVLAMIHPNTLGFYSFSWGVKGGSFLRILSIPLFITPYGLGLGYLIFDLLKDPLKKAIETPHMAITIMLLWILISLLLEYSRREKVPT